MRFEEKNGESGEDMPLNMTPMIDMVFLLLIFFLTATTFQQKEREKEIELAPAAKFSPLSAETRDVVINVTKAGKMIVMGKALDRPALVGLLRGQAVAGQAPDVLLRWDKEATGGMIIQAIDACAEAGVKKYRTTATPEGGGETGR
jgi:biopolymer transport protein ExbD